MTEAAPVLNLYRSAPGPVAERFMQSTAMVQILNGPIGSGKTTTCFNKALMLASQQAPAPRLRAHSSRKELVPVRQFKLSVIRDTYRQLWRTTLPSWFRCIPRERGEFTGAENAPAVHRLAFEIGAGVNVTIVDFAAEFGAIGDIDAETFMRGYEPTAFLLNELDLLAKAVLTYAQDRAGRFPTMADGGPTWRGILADCNAPEFESWLWLDEERDEHGRQKPGIFTMTPEQRAALGVALFVQPGGRDPGAENLKNLPAGYYTPKAGQNEAYIARMIDNQPGRSISGKPVHPEFKMALHVAAREIAPVAGLPLVIGIDPRTVPSAVFVQRLASGQRLVVGELQGEQNMGARRFGQKLAQLLHDRFAAIRPEQVRGCCDPSAQYGADREAGEQDWLELVSAESGVRIDAAPTNNVDMRREALKKPLTELIAGEPAILISPDCTVLTSALASGFRFRRMQVPGAPRFSDEVEKNHFADMAEACEYACLMDGADLEIRGRRDAQRRATAQRQAIDEWKPW